jgi:hypothetical protein
MDFRILDIAGLQQAMAPKRIFHHLAPGLVTGLDLD